MQRKPGYMKAAEERLRARQAAAASEQNLATADGPPAPTQVVAKNYSSPESRVLFAYRKTINLRSKQSIEDMQQYLDSSDYTSENYAKLPRDVLRS